MKRKHIIDTTNGWPTNITQPEKGKHETITTTKHSPHTPTTNKPPNGTIIRGADYIKNTNIQIVCEQVEIDGDTHRLDEVGHPQ